MLSATGWGRVPSVDGHAGLPSWELPLLPQQAAVEFAAYRPQQCVSPQVSADHLTPPLSATGLLLQVLVIAKVQPILPQQ
jgi:hypothetical protein